MSKDYPGFPRIEGPELMRAFKKQTARFGTESSQRRRRARRLRYVPVHAGHRRRAVRSRGRDHRDRCERALSSVSRASRRCRTRGVSACATCDGSFFRNLDVAVVGGGDYRDGRGQLPRRAVQERDGHAPPRELRASKIMAKRALEHPKIKFAWNSAVAEVHDVKAGKVNAISAREPQDRRQEPRSLRRPVHRHRPHAQHRLFKARSRSTRTATSRPSPAPRRPTSKACSPPATCRTTSTARRSPRPAPVVWPRSKPNAGWPRTSERGSAHGRAQGKQAGSQTSFQKSRAHQARGPRSVSEWRG